MPTRPLLSLTEKLPGVLRSPVYRALYRRNAARLSVDPDEFSGRHVLVLGPASTVADDLDGIAAERPDTVVRLNNGLDTAMAVDGLDPYRCDVLFHSLTADARPVTAEALRRAGVRLVVHRTPTRSTILATLEAEATLGVRIGILPVERYDALRAELDGASPSSGLMCLDFFLRAPVASLTVVGFTFFATRYVAGYDDRFATDAAASDRVRAAGHHDPDGEARLMSRRFAEARAAGMDLRLGAGVEAALARIAQAGLSRSGR